MMLGKELPAAEFAQSLRALVASLQELGEIRRGMDK